MSQVNSEVRLGRGIRVTDDRVLVRRDQAEKVSRGGIVLPDQSQEKPARGTVVAIGPGKAYPLASYDRVLGGDPYFRIPLNVAVGDTVFFSPYGGAAIEHEGEILIALREADVVAVLEDVEDVLPVTDTADAIPDDIPGDVPEDCEEDGT